VRVAPEKSIKSATKQLGHWQISYSVTSLQFGYEKVVSLIHASRLQCLSKGDTRLFKKPSLAGIAGIVVLFATCLAGAVTIPVSAATPTSTFLGASNTEPAFDFMTQDFVQSANGGNSVTFSFGGSGHLAGVVDGGVDFASDGTGNAPAGDALFASADEANVDNTIAAGAAASKNKGSVPKFNVGQCIDAHSATYSAANGGNNDGTSCPGIGSTRAQYTTGRLVIFSCKSGGQTLAPAQGAPTCAAPVSGFFSKSGKTPAPSTMATVWSDLLAHTNKSYGGSAGHNVGGYLAIADPKNGWVFSNTGCGPSSHVAPNAPYGLAGMEALYVAAVGYYVAQPKKSLGSTASDQACAEIDHLTGSGASLDNFNTTVTSSGGQDGNGNYSDPTLPIIFGDNVTYTQDSVVAGTSQIALLPKSFVVSAAGDDTDFWAEVPECGVSSAAHASVSNGWTSKINSAESCTDQDYVKGMHDNTPAKISSRNFASSPKTLVGEHGFYQPIRQWVVVENDDQGQSATADLTTRDGMAALAFIQYLLSAKGQSVLSSFGYDPIS
jgi:ABC-type molybdate transport system substrate-binding protein